MKLPAYRSGRSLVRIGAASINLLDLETLAGTMHPIMTVELPDTLGTDLADVVEAVGPLVEAIALGDPQCRRRREHLPDGPTQETTAGPGL